MREQVYRELKLENLYRMHEQETIEQIEADIAKFTDFDNVVFSNLLAKINKRGK